MQGGYLDPIRLNKRALHDLETQLGQYGYAAQVQQNPLQAGMGMFQVTMVEIVEEKTFNLTPKLLRSVRYWDKACLCAGTLIKTDRGNISIENIKIGMNVLTSSGYRQVEKAWLSKYTNELVSVIFSNGSVITGTPDHLVACKNKWIELQNLKATDIVNTEDSGCTPCTYSDSTVFSVFFKIRDLIDRRSKCQEKEIQNWKKGFLRGLGILGKKVAVILKAISGIRRIKNMSPECTIGKDIGRGTEVFPKVIIYTTKTGTGTITKYQTWKASHQQNTQKFTWLEKLPMKCPLKIQHIVKKQEKQHLRLFKRKRNMFVRIVEKSFMPKASKHNIAHLRVGKGIVPVYDLQIKDVPEFYANGILVHNSTRGGDGSRTAGVHMGELNNGMYIILDVVTGRWNSSDRESMIETTALLDGKEVIQIVEQEPGSGGKESAVNTIRRLNELNLSAQADRPTGDKVYRADPWSVVMNRGKVILIKAPWNGDYLDEHRRFPGGSRQLKDQVDASSGAYGAMTFTRKAGVW